MIWLNPQSRAHKEGENRLIFQHPGVGGEVPMGKPEPNKESIKDARRRKGTGEENLAKRASELSRTAQLQSDIARKQLQLSQARGNSNRMKGHRQRLKMDIINLRDELYRVSDKKYGSKHPGGGYYEGGERVTAYDPTLPRMDGNPEKVDWAEAGKRENKRLSDLDAARRNTPPKTAQLGGGSYGPGGIYRPNSMYRQQDINDYSPLRNGIQGLNENRDRADADRAVRNFYGMPETKSKPFSANATKADRARQRAMDMAASGNGNSAAALYEAQVQKREERAAQWKKEDLEDNYKMVAPLRNRLMNLTKQYDNFSESSYRAAPDQFKQNKNALMTALLNKVRVVHQLVVDEVNLYNRTPRSHSPEILSTLGSRIAEVEAAHRGLEILQSSGSSGSPHWSALEKILRGAGEKGEGVFDYLVTMGNQVAVGGSTRSEKNASESGPTSPPPNDTPPAAPKNAALASTTAAAPRYQEPVSQETPESINRDFAQKIDAQAILDGLATREQIDAVKTLLSPRKLNGARLVEDYQDEHGNTVVVLQEKDGTQKAVIIQPNGTQKVEQPQRRADLERNYVPNERSLARRDFLNRPSLYTQEVPVDADMMEIRIKDKKTSVLVQNLGGQMKFSVQSPAVDKKKGETLDKRGGEEILKEAGVRIRRVEGNEKANGKGREKSRIFVDFTKPGIAFQAGYRGREGQSIPLSAPFTLRKDLGPEMAKLDAAKQTQGYSGKNWNEINGGVQGFQYHAENGTLYAYNTDTGAYSVLQDDGLWKNIGRLPEGVAGFDA